MRKFLFIFQLKLLNKEESHMTQRKLNRREIQFLEEAFKAGYNTSNIRLREGEYQYHLAKTIASFQLELYFPNVKDIITRLYGEEKSNDIQFIRKIQTILKKMEKSNIVRILPKTKPWDLQRYALSCFKFQDIDKNLIVFATEEEIKQARDMLNSLSMHEGRKLESAFHMFWLKIFIFALALSSSYAVSVWSLMQPIINPLIFVAAFSIAIVCSLMFGKILSKR